MKSPVLLIGFNRPDNMCQVFAQIRKAQPKVFYIAVDGPRPDREGELEKCQQCQDLVKQVDWPCEIHTLFREKNVGCALGVSGAITWAFENEDRLIILEDDCVPSQSFFSFCDLMLEMYKDDTRVWQVCGRSYHPDSKYFEKSDYIFSQYAHIWGWATWKRCWNHYDLKMSDFPSYLSQGGAKNTSASIKLGEKENRFFKKIYSDIHSVDLYHTWDYQWGYTKLKNAALGIVPRKNLIHNIGVVGAHTTHHSKPDMPSEELFMDLRHPEFIICNRSYDLYHAKRIIFPHVSFFAKVLFKIKTFIHR